MNGCCAGLSCGGRELCGGVEGNKKHAKAQRRKGRGVENWHAKAQRRKARGVEKTHAKTQRRRVEWLVKVFAKRK